MGEVAGEYIRLFNETYYLIRNFDRMSPFFMSLVSGSDHWFFIASTGGLTAGRINPDHALFPYYTEDKLAESSEATGSKTIFLVQQGARISLWEPFSIRQQGLYDIQRNIYKNCLGTTIVFEEVNLSLGLIYRYAWRTGDRFGFIKTSWIENTGEECGVDVLDGIQNILPANAQMQVQLISSCLLDAYKRNQLIPDSGLAIYTLNATLTDLAEPSESLLATTVYQVGLEKAAYLLSSDQLDDFRSGQVLKQELETRGKRGSYFLHANLSLPQGETKHWHIVADVVQDWVDIVKTTHLLQGEPAKLAEQIETDIASNNANLRGIIASADGLQVSSDKHSTSHHLANVLFNVMRGGIFSDQYRIDTSDFLAFIKSHNPALLEHEPGFFANLEDKIHISELQYQAQMNGNVDLIRLSYTYLPLTFSRRHGDPSRPWNKFSVDIKNSDGSPKLNYQGNWRDIFQNWEALAYSFPEFVENMIFTFLNATTADGYNPYRITRAGIDWETPEPENPWSNIGYWSDHQIIYVLKLMELSEKVHPGELSSKLEQPIFSYANVPYRIKPFHKLVEDPYNTILFDDDLNTEIETAVKQFGGDRKLVCDSAGRVVHRNLVEKLFTLLLAKLTNFVPEGGIWMNTQRPEWNDANNALVGKGLSVVTLGFLYRFISFLQNLLKQKASAAFAFSTELSALLHNFIEVFQNFKVELKDSFTNEQRYAMLKALGKAGSDYREYFYQHGFSGDFSTIQAQELLAFLELTQLYIAHSLRANHRSDDLYHAYNTLQLTENAAEISHLDEILEGQVSILSSGFLSGEESLALLNSLQKSPLYSPEQNSYILYPDKELPDILEKNNISTEQIHGLNLPGLLVEKKDQTLLIQDVNGIFHFSGEIHNQRDVQKALENLRLQPDLAEFIETEGQKITEIFEEVFQHSSFTGRSSTFFAYEGLGSIYWHMVSKLMLAVQETGLRKIDESVKPGIVNKYREIRSGLGFNKSPAQFGAFPTDPYSHTPKGQGARQPGMSGVVKEEIITRQAELGLTIEDGCLVFNPLFINPDELIDSPGIFEYIDINGLQQEIELPAGSLGYTFCQTPIILQTGELAGINVVYKDGLTQQVSGYALDKSNSQHIFLRDNQIHHLIVIFGHNHK
jgi:hypothetical protein